MNFPGILSLWIAALGSEPTALIHFSGVAGEGKGNHQKVVFVHLFVCLSYCGKIYIT